MRASGDDITRAWGPFGFRTLRWEPWLTRFLAEFFGTFFVSFVGAFLRNLIGSAAVNVVPLPPPLDALAAREDNNFAILGLIVTSLAVGLSNFAATLSLGDVSGGHFNPAVSLMMWLLAWNTGDLELICVTFGVTVLYVGAQLGAASIGGWILYALVHGFGPVIVPSPVAPYTEGRAFVMELISSLFYLTVVLTTSAYAVNERGKPYRTNPWHPLSVGFSTSAASMLSSRVSFGVINPASHFTSAVAGGFNSSSWVYYAAPFSAALVVAVLYHFLLSLWSPLTGDANRQVIFETGGLVPTSTRPVDIPQLEPPPKTNGAAAVLLSRRVQRVQLPVRHDNSVV